MTENLKPNDFASIDDELARFADSLMASEEPEKMIMSGHNQELLALEETAIRLRRALMATEPDSALSSRIRANLVKEWRISGPQGGKPSFWARWLPTLSVTQPQLAGAAVVAAALALVVLGLPILLGIDTALLSGSAGNVGLGDIEPAWFVTVGIGLLALAAVAWWMTRRKR